MALIEEIDELEQYLTNIKDYSKRLVITALIKSKKSELFRLNTIKESND